MDASTVFDPGYAQTAPSLSPNETPDNAVVVAERIPAADDTDSLTKTTIAKMCEYIAAGAADRHVIGAAQFAAQRFGLGRRDPLSIAWGVFWFLKHRVRRVLDEGNAFRVGEPDAADMLIAPAVLLRMQNPAEDCDGFTMAAAAMLKSLGVENQCIVTIACGANEPQRWSHVFGMVQSSNGEWFPLDCSHGTSPGWMVPKHRITRWQAWDLSGNPIDVQMPPTSNMRGYFPRRGPRGVGQVQVCTTDELDNVTCSDDGSTNIAGESPFPVVLDSGSSTSSTSSGLTPAQIASIINTGILGATRVAQTAELPAGATLTPSGQVIGSATSAISSLMPLALIALGVVVLVSLAGAGRK